MGLLSRPAPWAGAFEITGTEGDMIPLGQLDEKQFALGAVNIVYLGQTGLEGLAAKEGSDLSTATIEQIRSVDNVKLPTTDLASVPFMMRWFANTYGAYTPAVLIHDWLIVDPGEERIIRAQYADRYFRYMLASVGVAPIKRYLMWAGVALRTRIKESGLLRSLMAWLWVILAAAGIAAFASALLVATTDVAPPLGIDAALLWGVALAGPFVASVLWGRQYGAGLVASAAALWLLPPVVLVAAGYTIYIVAESVASRLDRRAQESN